MHQHYQTHDPVEAPPQIQKAKNLIEEFFGLTITDTEFIPAAEMTAGSGAGMDVYQCSLMSPSGREIHHFSLMRRPTEEAVTISAGKGFKWEKVLQTAIDNFINNPKGNVVVLGEWKPTTEKLEASRQG